MTKIITVKGAVQGIGYRPFISEKANEYGLSGYVKNCGACVEILVSGSDDKVKDFISLINAEVPAGGFVLSVDIHDSALKTDGKFEIIKSSTLDFTDEIPVFLPDIGICDDCLLEMLDKENRRYRHALISCAVCGPRVSILHRLPYDRHNTVMKDFDMCPACQRDYSSGRRHYAQTISCNDCGPVWGFVKRDNDNTFHEYKLDEGIKKACETLMDGGIIGFKGVSGYQFMCLPTEDAANRLRQLKGRENKPFAVMYPTIEHIEKDAILNDKEKELLSSYARPIVLVKKKRSFPEAVDRNSRYIGAFLPSVGAHRLILDVTGPLIVTSANKSDSPIIYKDSDFDAFRIMVDGVFYTDRDICTPQDDSVLFMQNICGRDEAMFIRRARGYYPLPVLLDKDAIGNTITNKPVTILAMGGDLKSCPSVSCGDKIMPSQHIGDLEDGEVFNTYKKVIDDLEKIFMKRWNVIVSDLHPRYNSSLYARELQKKTDVKLIELQHHFAHIYSVMAENSIRSAIGAALDGTGYGPDGKIWGGEFLYCNDTEQKRFGHLSYVKLVGGDTAAKNASLVSRCYMFECIKRGLLPEDSLKDLMKNGNEDEIRIQKAAFDANINTFETSSTGRFFDGVAAILGVADYNDYEGRCATMLEKEASEFLDDNGLLLAEEGNDILPHFSFPIFKNGDMYVADQLKVFADIYICMSEGKYSVKAIAYGVHMALVNLIKDMCCIMNEETGKETVCLSGGVFNNRIILKMANELLTKSSFNVYHNKKVPSGDGGISLGQAYYGLLSTNSSKDF